MSEKEFTVKNYKRLIEQAKEKYSLIKFTELEKHERYLLLRHDIDFSVNRAYDLAKIEADVEVFTTYFLWIGSSFYNIFEDKIRDKIRSIRDLGHDIGLHFDPSAHELNSKDDLEKLLAFEKNILDTLFDIDVKVFSFHNPNEHSLIYEELRYSGMINTYAKFFKDNVGYCSDSNGYWKYESLEKVLLKAEHSKLQILTHPCWWQVEMMQPRERIQRCIDGRAKNQAFFYDKLLKDNNRENIGKEI